jgi:hypothetical protein
MQVEVEKALKKMKRGKAAGPTGVTAKMLTASGDLEVEWLTDICNSIVNEEPIPSGITTRASIQVKRGSNGMWVLPCN